MDHMGCGTVATDTAKHIVKSVSPRMLVKPLLERYEQASKDGEVSLVHLLEIVGVLAANMDAASTANHHVQVVLTTGLFTLYSDLHLNCVHVALDMTPLTQCC